MLKVAIMTDSNSGITQAEANELGIKVMPMPFYIDDELLFEDISITQEDFFKKLENECDIKTSMPTPGDVIDAWDELLKEYDQVVYIPMSSGLSSSCATATALADEYEGRVFVVNNQRISVTMMHSVKQAMELAQAGKGGAEIKEFLESTKFESSIYIALDTLKYLKKGGRITPAAALIGEVLNIKPVLQIQGEKLDEYTKARSIKMAKKSMIKAMQNDIDTRFKYAYESGKLTIYSVSAANKKCAEDFAEELKKVFGDKVKIETGTLSLSVACHIGPDCLAIACAVDL